MKSWHLSKGMAALLTLMLTHQPATSQERLSSPSEWERFVESTSNTEIRDTFLIQTFSGLPTDNWNYTKSDRISIIDLSSDKSITEKHGASALKIPMDSKVEFEHFNTERYSDVIISIHHTGKSLMTRENLMIRTYRPESPDLITMRNIEKDLPVTKFRTSDVINNPPGIDLETAKAATNTANGYYIIDSIYAHGLIKEYSLFTGKGNWSEDGRWSELPAYRYRHALINGESTISDNIYCEDIDVGNGSINILPTGVLSAENITIYDEGNETNSQRGIKSAGKININRSMRVVKSFPERGKWYFVSFPFDVYASGIDPQFAIGDDQTKENGNYIYIQRYNGDKRANSLSQSGNWEVITKADAGGDRVIMKRNIGYLIAIDAAANNNNVSFTSKRGAIPSTIAKSGKIEIRVAVNSRDNKEEHNGWYLCGNPMPSALPLREIDENQDLDGYIYIYDGNGYKAYRLDSDYAIPPFSAFFVKANQSTTLYTHHTAQLSNLRMIATKAVSSPAIPEPSANKGEAVSNMENPAVETRVYMEGNSIIINELPANGLIKVYNMSGEELIRRAIKAGYNNLSLPLHSGIHIISIEAGKFNYRKRHLFSH